MTRAIIAASLAAALMVAAGPAQLQAQETARRQHVTELHVGVAQMNARLADVEGNLGRAHAQVKSAAAVGVEVIMLPEAAISGYGFTPEVLGTAEPLGGPISSQVSQWAQEYGIIVVIGYYEQEGDDRYNTLLVARPDGSLATQRKYNLTPGEQRAGFSRGPEERAVFDFNGVRCALFVCIDSMMDSAVKQVKEKGIQLSFAPSAGYSPRDHFMHEAELATPEGRGKYFQSRWIPILWKPIWDRQDTNLGAIATCNIVGNNGNDQFTVGGGHIIDERGIPRAMLWPTIIFEHMEDKLIHAKLYFWGEEAGEE